MFAESSTESKAGEVSDKADAIPDAVTCSEAAAAKPDPAAADAVVTSSAESTTGKLTYRLKNCEPHTCAKLIEIKLLYLQKGHGLHESGR